MDQADSLRNLAAEGRLDQAGAQGLCRHQRQGRRRQVEHRRQSGDPRRQDRQARAGDRRRPRPRQHRDPLRPQAPLPPGRRAGRRAADRGGADPGAARHRAPAGGLGRAEPDPAQRRREDAVHHRARSARGAVRRGVHRLGRGHRRQRAVLRRRGAGGDPGRQPRADLAHRRLRGGQGAVAAGRRERVQRDREPGGRRDGGARDLPQAHHGHQPLPQRARAPPGLHPARRELPPRDHGAAAAGRHVPDARRPAGRSATSRSACSRGCRRPSSTAASRSCGSACCGSRRRPRADSRVG